MVLLAECRPPDLRAILLAYPHPRRRREKYVPPVHEPGTFYSSVKRGAISGDPPDKWRINQLAIPLQKRQRRKYVFVPEPGCGSGVKPGALTGSGTVRTNDLAVPRMRTLGDAQIAYKNLGEHVTTNLNKTMEASWNTIYHYYERTLQEKRLKIEARKKKIHSKKGAKTVEEKAAIREKKIAKWIAKNSLPKRSFAPPPVDRGRTVKIAEIAGRMNEMAEPTKTYPKYVRPSVDPNYVDPYGVKPFALTHVASDRTKELTILPEFKLIKPPAYIPGYVNPIALRCIVSPRFAELATPVKKLAAKNTDIKENAFQVSRAALKYKATPRIIELAEPVER
ncbi:hypothetical protein FQR65_LT12092 [Abscondita terminalis]|nr:hypothetical protein FQR65_LT12092 [Abscondita terminalis]